MIQESPNLSRSPQPLDRSLLRRSLSLVVCAAAWLSASTQQPSATQLPQPAGTPLSWIRAAVANELPIIADNGTLPLRYRIHKIDTKGDVVREIIESRDGGVARLVERNGQPITAAEDAAERARLQAILDSPADFIKHHRRDSSSRDATCQLVRQMPEAMIYTYAPGQPQLPNVAAPQVVLDFTPDPAFHNRTLASDLLTGLAGRIWIDARTRRMTRVDGRVLKPVNFGWGILGRIAPGGTITLDQAEPTPNRWVYSRLDMHLTMRVFVKSLNVDDRMTAFDFQPLAVPVSVEQAVHLLLNTKIPLR
ncbi:MAG: hypothetical protein V4555_13315 [Acidobacteriota bacterium]